MVSIKNLDSDQISDQVTPVHEFTCTIKMIADTIGGLSITARPIPLNMSLKNSHIVCCQVNLKSIRKKQAWDTKQLTNETKEIYTSENYYPTENQ